MEEVISVYFSFFLFCFSRKITYLKQSMEWVIRYIILKPVQSRLEQNSKLWMQYFSISRTSPKFFSFFFQIFVSTQNHVPQIIINWGQCDISFLTPIFPKNNFTKCREKPVEHFFQLFSRLSLAYIWLIKAWNFKFLQVKLIFSDLNAILWMKNFIILKKFEGSEKKFQIFFCKILLKLIF